jgi:hypothetical protein
MAPFLSWKSSGPLTWYQAYNQSKHSRHAEFRKANLENLLNAVAALVVLLSSQFRNQDFTPRSDVLTTNPERPREGEPAIGEFFYVEYPSDWAEIELYSFDWLELKTQDKRFQKFDFDQFDGYAYPSAQPDVAALCTVSRALEHFYENISLASRILG